MNKNFSLSVLLLLYHFSEISHFQYCQHKLFELEGFFLHGSLNWEVNVPLRFIFEVVHTKMFPYLH